VLTNETNLSRLRLAISFHFHRLRRESTNYSLFKHRQVVGQIVSQHQSGTHWLKYMMANALSHQHCLPPPKYNHANDFIGGPKDPIIYPDLPRLISSHSIPPLTAPLLVKFNQVKLPKYVLLVRDIRASLVSNYRKWKERYSVDFNEFLLGDPAGKKYNSDLWWSIRFLNAWGHLNTVYSENMLTVHYESLIENTEMELNRVSNFLKLRLSAEAISFGVQSASKSAMTLSADPERPKGEVNQGELNYFEWYAPADRALFTARCLKYLKFDFNYDYRKWP
jgi:hypothetical protein